jgi:hypothetical protein
VTQQENLDKACQERKEGIRVDITRTLDPEEQGVKIRWEKMRDIE